MAEAMSVESIIEAYWITLNYWTKVRVPYFVEHKEKGKKDSGGWSDIDVVAFNPLTKDLILCESKAHGDSSTIKTVTSVIKDTTTFRESIAKILGNELIKSTDAKSLTVHIVANINKEDEFEIKYSDIKSFRKKDNNKKIKENKFLLEEIVKAVGLDKASSIKKISLKIESLFTVFSNVIENIASHEKKDIKEFQKRYGNLTLDIAREINRYLSIKKHQKNKDPYQIISPNFKTLFNSLGVDPFLLCKYFLDLENGSQSEKNLHPLLQKVSQEKGAVTLFGPG